MQTFIDFLVNNYLWFLVITIILIFALIGYLVDTYEKKEKHTENKIDANLNESTPINLDQSIQSTENVENNSIKNSSF